MPEHEWVWLVIYSLAAGVITFFIIASIYVVTRIYNDMRATLLLSRKIAKALNVNTDEDEEEKSAPDKGEGQCHT